MARAFGDATCGKCGRAFNALDHLYDEHPDRAPAQGPDYGSDAPPVLGDSQRLAADDELALLLASDEAPDTDRPLRWDLLAKGLAALTILHLAWAAWVWLYTPRALADPSDNIRLVSRDFHPHPSRPDILVLSASFVSLDAEPQPFPNLSVTLLDADDRPLAHREFAPPEYLLEGIDYFAPLNPQVQVPMLIEFVDPGEKAVGFELQFH